MGIAPWPETTLLATAAFLVYNTDHLLDSRRSLALPESNRRPIHIFFQENKKWLSWGLGGLGIMGLLLAFIYLPRLPYLQMLALPLLVAVGVYMLAVGVTSRMRLPFIKEPWVAIIFAISVWAGPLVNNNTNARAGLFMVAAFALTCLLNLLVTGAEEAGQDRLEGNFSLSLLLGPKLMAWVVMVLLGGVFYCCGHALMAQPGLLPYLVSGIAALTAILIWVPPRPGQVLSRRFLADLALALVGISLL